MRNDLLPQQSRTPRTAIEPYPTRPVAVDLEDADEGRLCKAPRVSLARSVALAPLLLGALACGAREGQEPTKYDKDPSFEAKNEISRLFNYTAKFYKAEREPGNNAIRAPHRCPSDGRAQGSVGPTPPLDVDCSKGPEGKCVPGGTGPGAYSKALWRSNPAWREAGFEQPFHHRFHYTYQWSNEADGYGGACRFTIRAFGDLDGDGAYSTFERTTGGDANGVYAEEREITVYDEFE